MKQSSAESFSALVERLYHAIHDVSAIAPTGSPGWSDDDAELLASRAVGERPDLIAVAQSARHGLLNVRRILLEREGSSRAPGQSTIEAYRQYHTFAAVHIFALVERLRNAPVADPQDSRLHRFMSGLQAFLKGD